MDADTFCRDRVAPPGSSLYYSTLHLPEEKKRALNAIHAFHAEMQDILRTCSDPGVARIKLQWWREELQRIYHGTPQHPIGHSLAPVVSDFGQADSDFHGIIEALESELTLGGHADFASLNQQLSRTAGAVWRLSALICGYRDPATLEYAQQQGCALALTLLIQDMRADAVRGRYRLPLSEAAELGIDTGNVLVCDDAEAMTAFVAHQVKRARALLRRGEEKFPHPDRITQLPILILTRIYLALLDEIARDGYRILTHHIALTPIRKFWIAWKTRKREVRGAKP